MVLNPATTAAQVFTRTAATARLNAVSGQFVLTFGAMNTNCKVQFHGVGETPAREFAQEVVRWIAAFEARYSRFLPDSLISRINAAAGEHWVEIDSETERLFTFCNELVFFTRGAFDPTALPLIRLWNWKQKPAAVPSDDAIRAAQELVGWKKLERRAGGVFLPQRGMCLDLGGIGKEYAVDGVMNMALARGIRNVLVDFGQDIRVHGHPPDKKFWWLGLEDALQPGKCWAGVAVTDHGVASSGDYLRHFQHNGRRYGHIIDPRTGWPVDNGCRAVSVIAPSCTIAGILTTTAFILGPKEGLQLIDTHAAAAGSITTDQTRFHTKSFYAYATPQN